MPFRNLARTIPSHSAIALPSGSTSVSAAVKSVSTLSDAAHIVAKIGPVTSTSSDKTSVVNTSTSARS